MPTLTHLDTSLRQILADRRIDRQELDTALDVVKDQGTRAVDVQKVLDAYEQTDHGMTAAASARIW